MPLSCVILAAGQNKRFYPFSQRGKAMFSLLGKPLIHHQVSSIFAATGIKDYVIVVSNPAIPEYLSKAFPELSFKTAIQKTPLGTGDALSCAEGIAKGDFFVVAGDTVFDTSILSDLSSGAEAVKSSAAVVGKWFEKTNEYGFIFDSKGVVSLVDEKPSKPGDGYANTSIYRFTESIFDFLKKLKHSARGELELTDALAGAALVKTRKFWVDVGYPWKLLEALEFLFQSTEQRNEAEVTESIIKGKIIAEKGSEIIRSVINGPVYIGKNTTIGPNSMIRGAADIEADCEIGESTTIKASIVSKFTNAKHLAYIGDSVVGENCNFGSSTQIANYRFDAKQVKALVCGKIVSTGKVKMGAIVGDGVRTGVNSTILPGKIIGNYCWIYPGVIVDRNIPDNSRVYLKQDLCVEKIQ